MFNPPEFFHEKGLIKLDPSEIDIQENSILFTITYSYLYKINIDKVVLDYLMLDGQIAGTRSHDNMTAIITYLMRNGFQRAAKAINIFPLYLHPRDIIYMGYVKRKWWSYPLLPLLYIIFVVMAKTDYKVRPKWYDPNWWKQGFPKRYKIIKTDTEILFWHRLQLPPNYKFIHLCGKKIIPMLQKKYGPDYFQAMMNLYYRNPSHPNRNYKTNKFNRIYT